MLVGDVDNLVARFPFPTVSATYFQNRSLGAHRPLKRGRVQPVHLWLGHNHVNRGPCGAHGREDEIERCSQDPKFPNLTWVTYWMDGELGVVRDSCGSDHAGQGVV